MNPQLAPQLKPAVPLPFAARLLTVKVLPVEVVSPHPDECETSVAFVATPALLRVNVTNAVPTPQLPEELIRLTCHDPDRSDLLIVPTLSRISSTSVTMVTTESTARKACGTTP